MNRPIRLILIRPRDPNNIGACARAMANFGHTDLVVVDPYEPIWQETKAAPGAEDVVQNAQCVKTWEEAVKGCSIVLGTSSFHQRPFEQAIVELPNLNRHLAAFPASDSIALVFGSERSGLSNEELAKCQAVLKIPTNRKTPSMNLGQAVAIVLYELRRVGWEPEKAAGPAPAQELEPLIESLATLGKNINYPAGYEDAARLGRIRKALGDSVFSPATVRFFLSFIRRLLQKTPE